MACRGITDELVILGGASLHARQLTSRATQDMDVFGIRLPDGSVRSAHPLSEGVRSAALDVATALGLPIDPHLWLDDRAGIDFVYGAPSGFEDRLECGQFGALVVWHFGRTDILAIKLLVAAETWDAHPTPSTGTMSSRSVPTPTIWSTRSRSPITRGSQTAHRGQPCMRSCGGCAMRSDEIHKLVLDLLWSQWRALGVAAATDPSPWVIDLEALMIETARRASDGESRIRDGAISWLTTQPQLVTTVRLRNLLNAAPPEDVAALAVMARQVADNGHRLAWPMASDAPKWTPSTAVNLPQLPARPALLRIWTRALFGSNARAEVVAFLATGGSNVGIPVIVLAVGYSRRQVVEALTGLELGGWVTRAEVGKSSRYALDAGARANLGFSILGMSVGAAERQPPSHSTAPVWLNWSARYALLAVLGNAAARAERGDVMSALIQLRRSDDAFRHQGIAIPDSTSSAESQEDLGQRLTEWMGGMALRLAGRGVTL